MASTKASGNRVSWTYTDDDGADWSISAKGAYVLDVTDGAKYGGAAAGASVPPIPGNMRPRRVCSVDASGNQRYVIAYELTATIWTTPGTALELNYFGSDVAFTTTNRRRGERTNRRGTYQSA
jgi:hypothetical protein